MPGLVWIDQLTLSWSQYLWFAGAPVLAWILYTAKPYQKTVFLCIISLWGTCFWLFANIQTGIDVKTTWTVLPRLHRSTFLSELGFTNYLKFQPPLWTWFLLLNPSYLFHQFCSCCLGMVTLYLVYVHIGPWLSFCVISMPLYWFVFMQPSNDAYACFLLCCGVVLINKHKVLSGLCFGLAAMMKYTVYVMIPFLVLVAPMSVGVMLCCIVIFWGWALSLDMFWPFEQTRYLIASFFAGAFGKYYHRIPVGPHKIFPWYIGVWWTLRWRWQALGQRALLGGVWYLFPVWLHFRWREILLCLAIIMGYGNIKYFSLILPLLLLHKKETL